MPKHKLAATYRRLASDIDEPLRRFVAQRRQQWRDHFRLTGALIEPLTEEGIVTARLLKFNLDKRVIERKLLIALGRYPRF